MILVIAGNYREFIDFCREELEMGVGVAGRFACYVHSRRDFRGHYRRDVVVYGTYYNRPDFRQLMDEVRYLARVR